MNRTGGTIKSRALFLSAILLICTLPLNSEAESAQVTSTDKDTLAIQWHGTVNPSEIDLSPVSEHCIGNDGSMFGMARPHQSVTNYRILPDLSELPYSQ